MGLYSNLKWFITNCTILGLLPPFQNGVFATRKFILFIQLLILGLIIFAYVQLCTQVGLVTAMYNDGAIKILQVMFLNVIVIQFVIVTNLLRIKDLQLLFDSIRMFDSFLEGKSEVNVPHVRLWFFFTSGVTTILVAMSTILYIIRARVSPMLALDIACKYYCNVMIHFLIMLLYAIKLRVARVNWMTLIVTNDAKQEYVTKVARMAELLYDAVDYFNSVFGWTLFLIYVHLVLYMLRLIHVVLMLEDNWIRLLQIIVNVLLPFIQGVVVATMCEKVVDEGKRTIVLSYKALNRYSGVPAMREKLSILTQQATARCPQFSAAGFFTVDFSMLFTFVNLITTYVIVIIQFAQGNSASPTASPK